MSLLITSSQSKENTNSIGIERPENYINHFRGSLEIPPNSQIAVDSVKINRDPLIDFQDGATTMFWFGERVDLDQPKYLNNVGQTTSSPIVQTNLIQSSVGISDFQEGFRRMLREAYCYHPEINTSFTQNGSLIEKVGSSTLSGFKFQFQQTTAAPTSALPAAGQEINYYGGTAPLYDPASGSMTSTETDQCLLFACEGATNGPVSLNNGSVTFDVSNASSAGGAASTRQYIVGVVRAFDYNAGTILDVFGDSSTINLRPRRGLGQLSDTAWDYCAQAKDGQLRLYHLVRRFNPSSGDVTGAMKEIIYYSKTSPNNGSNSSFATGSPINASTVTSLTFNFKNEILTVTDQTGAVIVTVNDSSNTDFKNTIPKPVNQACWKMYPQMYLFDTGRTVALTEYHQRTGTTMDTNVFFGKGDWGARCTNRYFTGAGGAYNDDEIEPWEGSKFWAFRVEKRSWMSFYNSPQSSIVPKNPYKGVTGATMDGFENIFIVGRNERYLARFPEQIWQPNTARQLGMYPFSIFPTTDALVSGLGSSFTSGTPETSSQSSAFIRLPRFSHSSFNCGKGSVSKILAMIPRFDNAGNDSGALFFKNADKVYLDLNNSAPLRITDIQVDIVRRDETFVEDLTGSTEVIFHIRDKPKM